MYTSIEYVIVYKVMLNLHVFGRGRSTYFKPEFCVDGILLIE